MDLSHLAGLSEMEFEAERNRIIREYIFSLPEGRRKAAYLYQLRVDKERIERSPEDFTRWLGAEMVENLLNLEDALSALKQAVQGHP
jgi:hypothetical protein